MLSGYSHQIGPGMYNPVDKQSCVFIELIHCDSKHNHCEIQIEAGDVRDVSAALK